MLKLPIPCSPSPVHNVYRDWNKIIPSIRPIISLYNSHIYISVLLITAKYTGHSSFRLHFLSINGNGIYLRRERLNCRLRKVPFLRKKKFRSRVRAVRIVSVYANCESRLKSEFTARCDWCRNSSWERCPGMNETSWLCKRAGLPRRSKPVNAKVFHFEYYSSLSFRRRQSHRRLLLNREAGGFTSDVVRTMNCRTAWRILRDMANWSDIP